MGSKRLIDLLMRERLADYAHRAWSGWMCYMFKKCTENEDGSVTIPYELVQRWTRQLRTPYDSLTYKEQESDREQAVEILEIINT